MVARAGGYGGNGAGNGAVGGGGYNAGNGGGYHHQNNGGGFNGDGGGYYKGGGGGGHYQQNNSGGNNRRPPSNRGRNFQGYEGYEGKCQICKRTNHLASDCDWRYADNNSQPKKIAAAADASYGVDTNWYMDTGATNHITGQLEKLTMHEKYHGQDQVYTVANDAGMEISHIGKSLIRTPQKS